MEITNHASTHPGLRATNGTLQLLAARREEGSRPGQRSDDRTLALVVEGGGMRGVVSGGMVTGLEQLGIRDEFDFVVGISAGALAGAYFLARQARLGTSIYYEDLVGREWLDYRRALRRDAIVSLDFLIDTVMESVKPLDYQAILDGPVPLYAVATSVRDFRPVVLGNFTNRAELREALRASARIPFASGAPVRVRDEELIDGSVSQSIPVEAARELGATHVLALLTRPKGELRGRQRTLQKFGTLALLNRYLPGLGEVHATRPARYADEIKLLEELEAQDLAHAIQLSAAETSVRQLEQDPRVLFAGAAAGARAVHRHLTGVEPRFYGGLDIVADH